MAQRLQEKIEFLAEIESQLADLDVSDSADLRALQEIEVGSMLLSSP